MKHRIPEGLLSRFGAFVTENMGLHFPQARRDALGQGMERAAGEFGFEDPVACAEWLLSASLTPPQIEILASHLTVGETYFFREKRSFETLEREILPELIRARRSERRLRIWSAGCCTGEEPYSIAMLLSRMVDLREWNVTILGTDINPLFLRKAVEGVYTKWSFRDTPNWVREGYFETVGKNRLAISPLIKGMVGFSYLNLAEDAFPSLSNNINGMDLIFCRNVMMYFTPEQMRRTIRQFHRTLVDGGWLLVSPTEASHTLFAEFAAVQVSGTTLYQKAGLNGRPVAPPPLHQQAADVAFPLPFLPVESTVRKEVGVREPVVEAEAPREIKVEIAAPGDPESMSYAEAAVLYERGEYAGAEAKLVEWLASGPGGEEEARSCVLLARIYANRGKLPEALAWCDRAISLNRLDPGNFYLRAIVLQELGRGAEGRGVLRQALYLDGGFVMAHFALGNMALQEGQFGAGRKHFENALACLSGYGEEEALPEAEGLVAGRMEEMIRSALQEVSA
jgi:chemotaxis protein methyltransferase CheR